MDSKLGFGLSLAHLTRSIILQTKRLNYKMLKRDSKHVFFSSSTDNFLNNIILEKGSKREANILKYIELTSNSRKSVELLLDSSNNTSEKSKTPNNLLNIDLSKNISSEELMSHLEDGIHSTDNTLNDDVHYILVYLSKTGNTNGVRTVQLFLQKCNLSEFGIHSGYKHYLAQALWIKGNIEEAIQLFSEAYDNILIQHQVKCMMKCLFPLLITNHSEGTLIKTVLLIQQFTYEKNDNILLSCLWREFFLSSWFSDQQIAQQVLDESVKLIHLIQWMIPSMGKQLLKDHRVEDFYRLIEFTLRNNLKQFSGVLIRLLFDYYYIHQNIERCSAVVKYSTSIDSHLTDEQHRRYVGLLLKSKNAVSSKLNIKKPQNLKYDF